MTRSKKINKLTNQKQYNMSSKAVTKHRKKTKSLETWSFFNQAHLRCMKNEAGLRPMKRAFGSRKASSALRLMATKLPHHRSRKASASYSQSECFMNNTPSPWFNAKVLKSSRFYDLVNKIKVIREVAPEPKAVTTELLEYVVPAVAINVPSSNLHTEKYGLHAFGCVSFHW